MCESNLVQQTIAFHDIFLPIRRQSLTGISLEKFESVLLHDVGINFPTLFGGTDLG